MKVVDGITRWITCLVMIGLMGSYTAPYINPNTCSLPSLLGLAYHYLLLVNVVLLLYWICRRKKIALCLLGLLLAGYPFMRRYYGMNVKGNADLPCDMEILSYNVHHLDNRGLLHDSPDGKRKIESYIRRFPGDIVCLQDFPHEKNLARMFPGYRYSYAQKDLVILSRREIIHRGTIEFDRAAAASCIYCDILLSGNDTVRVYCVHLESFRFDGSDRRLILDFPGLQRETISRGLRSIISRLLAANKRRAEQAAIVKAHVARAPYKIILCGDFNDIPLSYTYTLLKRGMHDSFIEKGRGVGNTYIGEFPSFRIDHILHDPALRALSYARDTLRLSDHYPIRATFGLRSSGTQQDKKAL
ncbi:MAG: endonuclease/exonuclease/phosphatase family protein [Odoribacteraceae bacterium]|jgi:endonuclease/exonuclease/phosphatase family metal-dependent hydrolase|nr:endonuclease/exonuclease/phosphatase family protein [Odoribacteraceae bacterium]